MGPNWSTTCFCEQRFYRNTAMLICLWAVYSYFCATMAKLSTCNRPHTRPTGACSRQAHTSIRAQSNGLKYTLWHEPLNPYAHQLHDKGQIHTDPWGPHTPALHGTYWMTQMSILNIRDQEEDGIWRPACLHFVLPEADPETRIWV